MLQHSVQNGPTWCKSSCHEVESEFFVMSAPDPPHWPLNSRFGVFSYSLDAFGTVWLPYKTLCKMGRSGAKLRDMKSCRNFSQRTFPIHPIGPLPHVSMRFVLFGYIWDSLLRYNTQFKTSQTCAKVRATKSRHNFSLRTHLIQPIGL